MVKRLDVERHHTDDQGRHRDHLREAHHHFLVDDPPARPMSVESVMAGWPSHLDLPAKEDDGTSWNKRVDAHGLSVELLDAMWYAAAVDHQSGYKQKCLRWIGPYFPGTTAEERKVQTVEQNNMAANVKVAVLGQTTSGCACKGKPLVGSLSEGLGLHLQ